MTTEQTIPLNQLIHSKANVRQTGKTEGIGELAASIAAHGLRQNLNVLPTGNDRRFEVVAGGRRLRAMKHLVRTGHLAKDAPVACLVLGEDDDPAEISLVENAVRTSMHPDDQFEAFRFLIEEKSQSMEAVAARFGVTPAVVRQRLKLANVSPKLRALFRKGEMGLDHVMALAISDDHAAQEQAWENLPDWNRDPSLLKDALTHDTVPMTDRLAKFIGADAYVEAGGSILRDLFDAEDKGYLSDRALVMRLVTTKLDRAVEEAKAEGWKWVKAEINRDYSVAYGRISPSKGEGGKEDKATFSADDKARAGAIVRVGYDGTLEIDRGCFHPDDMKAEARRAKDGVTPDAGKVSGYSAALVEDLTAHRTAALRNELARNPTVALAFTVHRLACQLMHRGESSCLAIRATSEALDRYVLVAEDSPAHAELKDQGQLWSDRLPGDSESLLVWCLAQKQEELLELLAYLASLTVDAIQHRQGNAGAADDLAKALKLDMARWWNPSVEGFFGRLSKAQLIEAMGEAKVTAPAPLDGIRKPEAAKMAAKALQGSGWLPEPLRVSV